MEQLQEMSFHESTVKKLCHRSQSVELELEDVLMSGQRSAITLQICSVLAVLIDGVPSESLAMEAEDGEVLMFGRCDGGMTLIVEWHLFAEKKVITRSYTLLGESVSMHLVET